ncbi:uncharacterized protein LOC129950435 [Eupeodes corollae]|uniref:uncharacterized protein LOC129950435 n=1 Tax=Eupeodes corollae TaxID=290404 RepID=UPI0024901674|nr:uncharacterized protein LOC129950435 [Eupeodes corollae]
MTSDEKLCDALKATIDDLNEHISNHQEMEAIEAENKLLREKKAELIANLNRPSLATRSLVMLQDIQLRQKNLNLFRNETRENSVVRFKDRVREADSETSILKQKLKGNDSFMNLPYHEVLNKIRGIENETAEHRLVIENLSLTDQLSEIEQTDVEEAEDVRFIGTLKKLAEEQR